jgi:hypothetical protein
MKLQSPFNAGVFRQEERSHDTATPPPDATGMIFVIGRCIRRSVADYRFRQAVFEEYGAFFTKLTPCKFFVIDSWKVLCR